MKKAILTIFTFFFLFSLNAQTFMENPEFKFSDDDFVACSYFQAFKTDDQGYMMLQVPFANIRRGGFGIPKERTEFFIHQFDHDFQRISTTRSKVPKDLIFIGTYDNENEMISLFVKYVKKTKTYALYKANTPKNTLNPVLNISEYIMCKLPVSHIYNIYFTSSEDKTKHAVTFISTNKKRLFQGIYTIVLDDHGDIVWETIHKSSSEDEVFEVKSIEISNQGEVNVAVHSYFKKKSENSNITIFNISQNGTETFSTEFPYGYIKDIMIKTLRNETIFVAGYYVDANTRYQQLFSIILDPKTASFSEIHTKDLLSVLEANNETAYQRLKQGDFNSVCSAIEQLDNGNIVFLGEEKMIDYELSMGVTGNMGISYSYYLNSIFLHIFSEDGMEINDNVISKEQLQKGTYTHTKDMHGMTVSFHYINTGNNILLLYNDNKANYDFSSEEIKPYRGYSVKDAYTILVVMDSEGNYEKFVLNADADSQNALTRVPYIGEQYALLTFMGEKASYLTKFFF